MIITKDIELKVATPYMLRSDGQLYDCGDIHPYIKYIPQLDDDSQIRDLLNEHDDWLIWCFEHTDDLQTKFNIYDFLDGVFYNNDHYTIKSNVVNYFTNKYNLTYSSMYTIQHTNRLFNKLNWSINSEFTRLRMSNLRYGGDSRQLYCRISDTNILNSGMWIKYIRNIVKDHISEIEDVTIVNDTQSLGGHLMYYRLNNKDISNMSPSEFVGP